MGKTSKYFNKVKLPKSRHEFEEFGKGKKGLAICGNCDIFYYQKSWHHNADTFISKRGNKDMPVNFVLCPACQMIKNRQYEGKIVVQKIPSAVESELINLIKNFSQKAFSIDPLHRLIGIKKEKGNLIATTTENELANKIAKKIKSVFHKVKAKVSFNKEPSDVALVTIEFV